MIIFVFCWDDVQLYCETNLKLNPADFIEKACKSMIVGQLVLVKKTQEEKLKALQRKGRKEYAF